MTMLEVGDHISVEIIKYPDQAKVEIRFIKINPGGNFDPGEVMDLLANHLREQFAKQLNIKGTMITRLYRP